MAEATDRLRLERGRQRGFALIVVLGALPMLTMLVSVVQLSGRTEIRLAANLRGAAVRDAAADGAIREAIFRLVAGEWAADGTAHELRVGDKAVAVRIEDEGGKINPSVAPIALLRALLLTLGVEPGRAESLAACIFDYHDARDTPSPHGAKAADYRAAGKAYGPSGLPFQRLDELRLVLGMTREMYERLVPYLSIQVGEDMDLTQADPVVRAAYRLAGPYGGYVTPRAPSGVLTALVTARSADAGGSSSEHAATVRVYDSGSPDDAYDIVDWAAGEP